MRHIIELAERLGKLISDSPQAEALRKARKAVNDEPDIAQALKDFRAQSDKIARLEAEQKPVEVDDKRKLRELHDKLVASGPFKALSAAQVEYVDLMRKVNEALQKQLSEVERD